MWLWVCYDNTKLKFVLLHNILVYELETDMLTCDPLLANSTDENLYACKRKDIKEWVQRD